MKWFRHDTNAHRDAKLKKLKMRHGMSGYGLYWFLIEQIADGVGVERFSFELEYDSEIIAHETGIHQDDIEAMMRYMIELQLFEESNGVITCLKLAKRLDQSMTSNPEMRKLIAKIRENHDGVMTPSEQIRLDKIRLDNKGRFTPPSAEEVQEYLDERGITRFTGQTFVDHYAATGWYRGKSKIKSWKHCVGTWNKNAPADDVDVAI